MCQYILYFSHQYFKYISNRRSSQIYHHNNSWMSHRQKGKQTCCFIDFFSKSIKLNQYFFNRLVLLVADGLRAESFLRDNLTRTPYLRDIILNKGIFGISHTHVPTESRPGHVALIAGFYEDPSAVLKGWQHNPVDFDSVFNQSRVKPKPYQKFMFNLKCLLRQNWKHDFCSIQTTYAWGSPDIISIFTNPTTKGFVANAYTSDSEDFSGKSDTAKLDTWVFDKANDFIRSNANKIVDKDRIVFFLHLLGLDTGWLSLFYPLNLLVW